MKGRCPRPLDDGDVRGARAVDLAAARREINRAGIQVRSGIRPTYGTGPLRLRFHWPATPMVPWLEYADWLAGWGSGPEPHSASAESNS